MLSLNRNFDSLGEEINMGLVYANIQLSNDVRPDLSSIMVNALVDSGAINLCLPAEVVSQLGLKARTRRVVQMADESTLEVDVVSPVTIVFENRETTTTALVLGDEVLLGAIPMQDMDVLIDPRNERLIVNPDHPNFAMSKVK
jgi:clan AA aspartic protease